MATHKQDPQTSNTDSSRTSGPRRPPRPLKALVVLAAVLITALVGMVALLASLVSSHETRPSQRPAPQAVLASVARASTWANTPGPAPTVRVASGQEEQKELRSALAQVHRERARAVIAQVKAEAETKARAHAAAHAAQAKAAAAKAAAAKVAADDGDVVVRTASVPTSGSWPWPELRACETRGHPDPYVVNTGNGYYGAYQFSSGTWESVGESGLPHQASPATQDAAARRLQARSGWGQWPKCSRQLGLR